MATHNNGNEEKLNRGLKWEKKFKGKQVVGQKTNNGKAKKNAGPTNQHFSIIN